MTNLRIEQAHPGSAIRLAGELDHASAPDLIAALAREVNRNGDLEVDMTELTFMDSTGLHILIDTAKQLSGRGTLVLTSPTGVVARLLELSGITGKIPNLLVRASA